MSGFPLLRNISIRMTGCESRAADLFERALSRNVESLTAQTTPAAMAMLLVATAMFVAPLAMAAPKAVELVRIITGLLYLIPLSRQYLLPFLRFSFCISTARRPMYNYA